MSLHLKVNPPFSLAEVSESDEVRRAIEWLDHRADSNESNLQIGLNLDSLDHSGHTKTLN